MSSERGGGGRCQTFSFSFFPCSADHERDWPPCKVIFFGLATNVLNVRNNNDSLLISSCVTNYADILMIGVLLLMIWHCQLAVVYTYVPVLELVIVSRVLVVDLSSQPVGSHASQFLRRDTLNYSIFMLVALFLVRTSVFYTRYIFFNGFLVPCCFLLRIVYFLMVFVPCCFGYQNTVIT